MKKYKIEWRIYYDDGTIRDYKEGLPVTADEHLGIMVVLQRRTTDGRLHTIYGAEYYLFDGEVWVPIGLNGLEDWVMNLLSKVKCVIKGRAINNGIFREIYEQAKKDALTDKVD